MSNPLAALGSVGSLISGAASLINNKSQEQYRYQTMLNRQQQAYARENRQAELSNQYQYQFNLPLLNKKGMQASGYSLAGIESGSVSSASTPGTASPSAGAAPTGATDVQAQLGVANLLQQLSLVKAQTENVQEEARGKKIKNDVDEASMDSDKLLRQSQSIVAKVEASNAVRYGGRKAQAETIVAEIETQLKDMEFTNGQALGAIQIRQLNLVCDNLLESLEYLKKQERIADATYDKLRQDIRESRARINNINATTENVKAETDKVKAETEGINLDNDSKSIDVEAKQKNKDTYIDNYGKSLDYEARNIDFKNDVLDNDKLMLELEKKFGRNTRERLMRLADSDKWYDSIPGSVLLWIMDDLGIVGNFMPKFK